MDLDAALDKLGRIDPRLADLVVMRFLGGLTIEETAEVLESSPATVKRDWLRARAWLFRELKHTPLGGNVGERLRGSGAGSRG
jgi:RNA polymerase sigma factor (sigma-70 family)